MTMKDLDHAIEQFRDRETAYRKFERYYNGNHDLAFATDKFTNAFGSLFREFSMNLCSTVVDALKDKLIITEFGIEEGRDVAALAWEIWQANRMGVRSGEIHKECLKCGDSYVIVWPDSQGKAAIYAQHATQCTVMYEEEIPGRIKWAAKRWTSDDVQYINIFYADRIEKYRTRKQSNGSLPGRAAVTFPVNGKDFEVVEIVENPFETIPVFHFANNSDIGAFGRSELIAAIPIQDALNKSVLDMMVAMEFQAYRQRWASGIEIEYNNDGQPIPPFQAGVSHLWISENPDARFGDFETADLEKFLRVKESFRVDLASTTGTPLHYFMLAGAGSGFPQSGFSLLKQETRFLNKVRDRQQSFGQVWEDVMAFAIQISGGERVRLFTEWEDPAPLSEKERLENLLLKKDIGVTTEQLLMEAGYGDKDIEEIAKAREQELETAARSFNSGGLE